MNHAVVSALIAATFLTFGLWAIRHNLRKALHLPAAPDNQPPTDDDLLITCRRIAREPLADPDKTRRLINYLRDTERGEQ